MLECLPPCSHYNNKFLHGRIGLFFLSLFSFFGIIGDFLIFGLTDDNDSDIITIVVSSFIFCLFLLEIVYEQLNKCAFLSSLQGWIYFLSTFSFLLDITLASRHLSLGVYVTDNNPSPNLSFQERLCVAFIYFVYGLRSLQLILRWTISRPLDKQIKAIVSQDPSYDFNKINQIGEELAEAHTTLHTKLGFCILLLTSALGALTFQARRTSSWDMFQLPLDCQCSGVGLDSLFLGAFDNEVTSLCSGTQCSRNQEQDARDWAVSTFSLNGWTSQLDRTQELQDRALFLGLSFLSIFLILASTTLLVETYLRESIKNLILSENQCVQDIEMTSRSQSPQEYTPPSPGTLSLKEERTRTGSSKGRYVRKASVDMSSYFERVVKSHSRRTPTALLPADDFASPVEKATNLLETLLKLEKLSEEEGKRIRLAYEIMLSDHSLQGQMTQVIAKSSHLSGDSRRWLLKTIAGKISTRSRRSSRFKTKIQVNDFTHGRPSQSSTKLSRVSESFGLLSPLQAARQANDLISPSDISRPQFTFDDRGSQGSDEESQDLSIDEPLDYVKMLRSEPDHDGRFLALQNHCTSLDLMSSQILNLTWNVDSFKLSKMTDGNPLLHSSLLLVYKFDLANKLNLDMIKFCNFVDKIQVSYADNIYHNRQHATDVTVSGCCLMGAMKDHILTSITHLQIFAVLISCIIHDVGHPGNTNLFETKTQSRLSLRYSDQSVLEFYHLSLAFKLLKQEENCFWKDWDHVSKMSFRKQVVEMVLATDLSKHFEVLDQLKSIQKFDEEDMNDEKQCDQIQAGLFKGIIKMADLSHSCKPIEAHKEWTMKISEEFWRQGDKETELGLEISPLCNRSKVDIPNGQIGFFEFIVKPLYTSCAKFFRPQDAYSEAMAQIEFNLQYWKDERAKAEASKEPEKGFEKDVITE